jgi:hypothetical protein
MLAPAAMQLEQADAAIAGAPLPGSSPGGFGAGADHGLPHVVPSSAWFGPSLGGSQEQEILAFLGSKHRVAVLQWPRDARHLDALSRLGLPRLLLVHPSVETPPPDNCSQMSLPFSADGDDLHRALLYLCRSAARRRRRAGLPSIDDEGWLRAGGGRIQLPPCEHRLASVLVARFGRPVHDDALALGEARYTVMTLTGLQGRLAALSQHVHPLGLEVATILPDAHVLRWCAG